MLSVFVHRYGSGVLYVKKEGFIYKRSKLRATVCLEELLAKILRSMSYFFHQRESLIFKSFESAVISFLEDVSKTTLISQSESGKTIIT